MFYQCRNNFSLHFTYFPLKTIATEKINKLCLRINSNNETSESGEHVNMIIRSMNLKCVLSMVNVPPEVQIIA